MGHFLSNELLKKVTFNNCKILTERPLMESFEMDDSKDFLTHSFLYSGKDAKGHVKHDVFFRRVDSQDVKYHHSLIQLQIDIHIVDFKS